ncbi:MAG: T9SS type A sorting domain-containing protein, partial [Bacteroidetes bacterium]|nr:T9SS type A sorting domain-containing protein [Bacteroidota bacterium]
PDFIDSIIVDPKLDILAQIKTTNLDSQNTNRVLIFPNPADENFTLRINATDLLAKNTLCIYDGMGRLIYTEETAGKINVLVDCSHYPSGVYVVKFATYYWKVAVGHGGK